METLYNVTSWLTFFSALALPQLLGLLVHYRMKRFPRIAYFTGFVITAVSSFFLVITFLLPITHRDREHLCGMAGMLIMMSILFFMSIQVVVSIIAQYWFYRRHQLS